VNNWQADIGCVTYTSCSCASSAAVVTRETDRTAARPGRPLRHRHQKERCRKLPILMLFTIQ